MKKYVLKTELGNAIDQCEMTVEEAKKRNDWRKENDMLGNWHEHIEAEDKGNGHTPGKLRVSKHEDNGDIVIRAEGDHIIANCSVDFTIYNPPIENPLPIIKSNAARIVECWNEYDKLAWGVNRLAVDNEDLKSDTQKKKDTIKELLELVKWISKVTNSPEIGIRCDKAIAKHNQKSDRLDEKEDLYMKKKSS